MKLKVILGKRDYEKTGNGKYPKYNLNQMNLFVSMDCPQYTGMETIFNAKSFDLFGKYTDEITKEQQKELDIKIKEEFGIHNVDINHFIDWDKFEYNKETKLFSEKV